MKQCTEPPIHILELRAPISSLPEAPEVIKGYNGVRMIGQYIFGTCGHQEKFAPTHDKTSTTNCLPENWQASSTGQLFFCFQTNTRKCRYAMPGIFSSKRKPIYRDGFYVLYDNWSEKGGIPDEEHVVLMPKTAFTAFRVSCLVA